MSPPSRTLFLSKFILVTMLIVPGAQAQKGDWAKVGPAEPPVFKASENTTIEVATDVPSAVTGALDSDDSTYNRQVSGCGGLSGIGTNVSYDTVTIENNSGILAALDVFTSDVGDPAACSNDTHISVYSPAFNAVDPLTGCVTSNDDSGPGACSAVSFDLGVGETAVVVVTSFANDVEFDYQVNIDSPSCSDGIVYDDGSFESGVRGPMGTQMFEIAQRFDLPLVGSGGAEVKRICACLGHTVSATNDFPLNFVVRRPTSGGDMPGARLHTEAVMANNVPDFPTCQFFTVDLAGVTFDSDTIFVGVEWDQAAFPDLVISEDTDGPTSQPSFFTTNSGGTWNAATGLDPAFMNLGVRATFEEPFTALSSSDGLLLPGFNLDLNDLGGRKTLLNVRNTTEDTVEANLSYYGEEVTSTPSRVDGLTLSSNRVGVVDLGTDVTDLDPDGDNIASGLVLVNRADTLDAIGLEGDFLGVDVNNNFATGDRLFRVPGDFCNLAEIRFFDFGSGTEIRAIIDQPRGDIAPSFSYTVYNQAGALLNTGDFFTNTHLNVLDAQELAGMGNRFGTLVFDFSKAGGGVLTGSYSAFGLYSVELDGACRD